jgi:hypothetical protein
MSKVVALRAQIRPWAGDVAPIPVTVQMFDRPYIMPDAGPIASALRERIAIWANEGGAGGEVSR